MSVGIRYGDSPSHSLSNRPFGILWFEMRWSQQNFRSSEPGSQCQTSRDLFGLLERGCSRVIADAAFVYLRPRVVGGTSTSWPLSVRNLKHASLRLFRVPGVPKRTQPRSRGCTSSTAARDLVSAEGIEPSTY